MEISIIFKIAALGIVITVLGQVLKHSGREEMTFLLSLAGLVIVLFWIVPCSLCNMLKIGIIGIAAVFFAVLLKRDRPELSMLLSVACGTIIFAFALERLGTTIEFFKGLLSKLPVEPAFFVTMVKMLGIAYIAEFSSSICKDCGHSAIASQIELFAKGAIVVMSIPVMSCLIELIGELF